MVSDSTPLTNPSLSGVSQSPQGRMGPTARVRGRKGALLREACRGRQGRVTWGLEHQGFVTAAAQFFSTQCPPRMVLRLNLERLSSVSHEVPSSQPVDMDTRRSSFLRLNYTESHAPAPLDLGLQPCLPVSPLPTQLSLCWWQARHSLEQWELTTACLAENAEWNEGEKKNPPSRDSYTGRSYKQFGVLKLILSLASEKRVSIEADCNKNALNVYSTYLFIFRNFSMLPPSFSHKIWPSYSASILIPCSFA